MKQILETQRTFLREITAADAENANNQKFAQHSYKNH